MTSKRYIFEIKQGQLSGEELIAAGIDPTKPGWGILCVQSSHSNKPEPQLGYRLNEYKTDYSRLGPWKVESEGQCYLANMPGMQDFDEVWMYECVYDPLPEADNPWREVHKLDPATYPDWLKEEMGMTAAVVK